MKKIILSVLLLNFLVLFSYAQRVNDKVQVEHAGFWYDAVILKANAADGTFLIKYKDWDDSWNEWVGTDRIKGGTVEQAPAPLTKFSVGDKVEVDYGMVPAPATVIEVGTNKYHIKFDKSVFGDKWVTEREVKRL
ncbi:MAG: At domain protein [Bacteroidota bacterium]|nr:At domain protein [Bacteroidota bacterium]